MEWDVKIYFTINGPTLLKKGVAENLYVKKDGKNGGGMPLSHFIEQARDLGVELLCCQPSLDLNDLDYEELIDGVKMIGGAAFNSLAAKASAVVCF
jgi:predicted peroxiredoxin